MRMLCPTEDFHDSFLFTSISELKTVCFAFHNLCTWKLPERGFVIRGKRKNLVYCPWKFPLVLQLFLIAHTAAMKWKCVSSFSI